MYLKIREDPDPRFCWGVSNKQAELMLRAIGADVTPCRTYRDSRYYYATQNRADKGADDTLWALMGFSSWSTSQALLSTLIIRTLNG